MSSLPPPFEIPVRKSLSDQVVAAMRMAIGNGTWHDYLPSERRLCQLFQVSRPTIRTALHRLAKERHVEILQGRRTRLLTSSPPAGKEHSRLVLLITPEPVHEMSLVIYQRLSEVRAHLADHGFSTEIMVCAPQGAASQRKKIEAFIRQNRVACCVLASVGKELQQWFSESDVPALVLGSCHPNVKLPFFDLDNRSVCRHAAGIFLGKGHRHLALVVPNSGMAGDLASEAGFLEAAEIRSPNAHLRARVVRHNGTAENINFKLDGLFDSDDPPTALLVAKPQHVFIVIFYLLKRGLAVPDKVSLIARDHDPAFENVIPPVAHYAFEDHIYEHRLTHVMLQMVTHGHLAGESNLILPKFFPGGTVKHVR